MVEPDRLHDFGEQNLVKLVESLDQRDKPDGEFAFVSAGELRLLIARPGDQNVELDREFGHLTLIELSLAHHVRVARGDEAATVGNGRKGCNGLALVVGDIAAEVIACRHVNTNYESRPRARKWDSHGGLHPEFTRLNPYANIEWGQQVHGDALWRTGM